MIKNFRKLIAILLVAAILFTACLFTSCGDSVVPDVSPQASQTALLVESEVYMEATSGGRNIKIAFYENMPDIPMISIEQAVEVLNTHIQTNRDAEFRMDIKTEGNKVTLTRENGAYSIIDFDEGTIFFDDYNMFCAFSYDMGGLDILESTGSYFKRVMASETTGKSSLIDLKARQIPLSMQEGKGYITLQTFTDIYLAPHEVAIAYNSESLYFVKSDLLGNMTENYYDVDAGTRSKQLADITYRQLCLLFDFHYGLAEEHGFSSTDEYITRIGLKDAFYSENIEEYSEALKTFLFKHITDNHTGVLTTSPYNENHGSSLDGNNAAIGYWEFYGDFQMLNGYRQEQKPEPYEEIGNTAFITFDVFTSATKDYYANSPLDGSFADEVGLISYAHAMINRENSPIENVVIDLATNTGGHMDGGIYLVSWILGNALMHIEDPIRGAQGTFMYRADVNLDGVFDEKDVLTGKNVYLLTSPITFSCANYVANALKESAQVTIIGTTSGGGTCAVYMASTASGDIIAMSSSLRFSSYKNGSYYSLDEGIAPDYKINNVRDLFSRNKIVNFIESIY